MICTARIDFGPQRQALCGVETKQYESYSSHSSYRSYEVLYEGGIPGLWPIRRQRNILSNKPFFSSYT
jgi:hypothetical protein